MITQVLQVAVFAPQWKVFDYLPLGDLFVQNDEYQYEPGARVMVPFGHRSVLGVILAVAETSSVPLSCLKSITTIIDNTPLLPDSVLRLCKWVSQYYHFPIGEVLSVALPVLIRQGALLPEIIIEQRYQITESGRIAIQNDALKRSHRQYELLQFISLQGGSTGKQVRQNQFSTAQLKTLIAKKFIENLPEEEVSTTSVINKAANYILNDEQATAIAQINENENFGAFLLQGVTGSGKTEVYFQCMEKILNEGKQALILVPEIGLTPQLVSRVEERFTVPIVVMHSYLSDKDRAIAWRKSSEGMAAIIIGTRSAIFTPLKNPGIVIVDEEHDLSFKQQSGLRYSARDVAVMRARMENIPIVLGSATPCLESLYNVQSKRYKLLPLTHRAGEAKMPRVFTVDLCGQKMIAGLSQQLLKKMGQVLDAGKQVMLFLNRRGYAPTLMCHACGWTEECHRCDMRFTLHYSPAKLICHHCGLMKSPERTCIKCHQADLVAVGRGTERLEEELAEYFPRKKILRVDRDTAGTKNKLQEKLDLIHENKVDILIGTQMLAKGHHFPNLSMVVLIDADSGLLSTDFRALERFGQLFVQVAGRAGREITTGNVYLQTHYPDHPKLKLLMDKGYNAFANSLLEERKAANFPPCGFISVIRAEAKNAEYAVNFLQEAKELFEQQIVDKKNGVYVLGPIPSLMARKAGLCRYQLLIQAKDRVSMQQVLKAIEGEIVTLPSKRKVKWTVDVDAQEVL